MSASFRSFAKFSLWSLTALVVSLLAGALGVLAVVYGLVYFGDDSNLKKATILARINEETNIYMLDEKTPIGSIFSDAHRRYVPIDEVPATMINALIAAEDKNFYNHHGIDPVAIVSASAGVLKGGRVRGASTLTQQTARNILGWWDVTLSRKVKEAIASLQLERLYSKKQILEFYLNQFHVSGNGRGIGIAAKYYFNKDVKDLDLVESAFIAGSVKGPSQYDPFIKFTKERRERAIKKAYNRKNYVLRRMYEQGWVSADDFKKAWAEPVKFSRGSFRTDEVALVDLITEQVKRKEILEALGIEDERELSAAGLKVFSTIDGEMQKAGQLAVRRNLSRLETILKGFKQESPQFFHQLRGLTVNDFYFGQVAAIAGTAKEPELKISFGLPTCTIPFDSLMRYAKQVDLPFGQGWQKVLTDMVKKIKPGDVLYMEAKEYDVDKHDGFCELMKRPRVNGGLIAMDKGEIRAVVSGFDTHGFNRSMQAKRQPGSVFKPVVFFAALQLGWSILDRLDNERQIFPYQGQFYYPRPDHDSPYKETSMLWAGIQSENVASVSLTSKLVDKLNFEQFKQLLGVMDLLPHPGEAPRDFHFRVARAMGVTLDNEGVREFQLNSAVSDLMLDVQYSSTFEFQQKLKKMWWGRGYAAEMQRLMTGADDLRQKGIKLHLAENNFQRHQAMDQQLISDWKVIEQAVQAKGAEVASTDPAVLAVLDHFRVLAGLSKPALGYIAALPGERPSKDYKDRSEVDRLLQPPGRQVGPLDVQAIWGGSTLFGSADITLNDVLIDGWLPHGNQQLLEQYVTKHYDEVTARQDDFDLYRYYNHHDYRIAVGLNYLVSLAKAMGVTSAIEPVESFPLGTNVVTLAEVAKIYQTFVDGKTYRFYKEGPPNQTNLIRRIEDRYGNTLFEPKRLEYQLVQPEFGLQMREILRRVVTHGTGRRARAELYLTIGGDPNKPSAESKDGKLAPGEKRIRIPVFGKTGTTNDYNSANFAGFVPYPVEKGQPLDPSNSYVLTAYAGYDRKQQMHNGAFNATGALGALPAWIGLAKSIIEKKTFSDMLDTLDLSLITREEWPLKKDPRATPVMVDMARGAMIGARDADQEAVGTADSSREGESANAVRDEFRASVVEATMQMPLDGGHAPLRLFSPYKPQDQAALTAPTATRLGGKGDGSKDGVNMDDVRYYDQDGNRTEGPAAGSQVAPGIAPSPVPPAPNAENQDSQGASSAPAPTAPNAETEGSQASQGASSRPAAAALTPPSALAVQPASTAAAAPAPVEPTPSASDRAAAIYHDIGDHGGGGAPAAQTVPVQAAGSSDDETPEDLW